MRAALAVDLEELDLRAPAVKDSLNPGVKRAYAGRLPLDLHAIELDSESAGPVLLLDTIEHVEFPRKALGEIHRVLKPGGVLVMSSTMRFPIHDHPHDYWRFTPEAFRSLLKPFATAVVESGGREDFPPLVVGIGCKGELAGEAVSAVTKSLEEWKGRWREPPEG